MKPKFGVLAAFILRGICAVHFCERPASGASPRDQVATTTAIATDFGGTIVLGCPSASSIKANILLPGQSGSAYIEYGTTPGTYNHQTATSILQAAIPLVMSLEGLSANTQYYYRLKFQASGANGFSSTDEYSFHTARPAGSTFTFTIQADSHLDGESDLDLYRKTLGNVLADSPDFHLDLGDTFMCEKFSTPLTAVVQPAPDWATVNARYVYERANFGLVTKSVPLFLVNGNHEGEAGWLNDGSENNLAVWATKARQQYFINPVPDDFYSGDSTEEPFVGKRAAWYSWQWGNALFIVLDPFWNSKNMAGNDAWNITLGERQYQWLKETLSSSSATFKFVFIHNLVGGLDGQMRGGIEAAPYYESGGRNADGTDGFDLKRNGWPQPIHQLLVAHGVTAVFHGHDHLYARQELDGMVYQEVPQPSTRNSQSGPGLASTYHYVNGIIQSSSGHIRVTVSPDHVTAQYVRAWLPADETAQQINGQITDTWSIAAPGWPNASFSFDPNAPISGQPVAFTDASTGTPTSWAWNFGDGSSSSLQNPSHTYSISGTFTANLTVTNSLGSHSTSQTVAVNPSVSAAFTFAHSSPVSGEPVAFTDVSTGSPTAWAWNFGDGQKSTLENPSHVYSSSGSFAVTLKATNATGSKTIKHTVAVGIASEPTVFGGNIILGCPTATSIKANIFSPNQAGTVYIAYGTTSGACNFLTSASLLQAATPLELPLTGLSADTQYFYQLFFQGSGQNGYSKTPQYSFHTARLPGSTFTFCIQGDSHPERVNSEFNSDLYTRTLLTAAADQPDFYMTIGDDFSVDTLDPATVTASQVTDRYTLQRPYLGLIGRTAPIFLVNGNHEQAARYLLDGTPNNVAVWAQNARNAHYSQPAPDGFYSGNTELIPYIGLLRNHYAWTWGDALFVVIDPYWASPTCVDNPFNGGPKRSNLWDVTHGDPQYQWLKATLEQSHAKYKFVFAHHVMGTGRGGIEMAGFYEWGGYNSNALTWGFTANRPSWLSTIHQLMVDNHVTVFFQGHDHIWVHQQLDGVIYQTLSEPADPNYSLFNSDAFLSGDKFPNTGYTRVIVSPTEVKIDYVRTYLPWDEGPGKISGSTVFSYSTSDSVGDGIADWWRAKYFGGDGKTASAASIATGDPDHDGVDNLHEYLADTNPTDPLSHFGIENISKVGGFTISFQSSISRQYTLYYSDDLTSGVWTALPTQTDIPGSGGVDALTDPSPMGTRRFYRIGVQAP